MLYTKSNLSELEISKTYEDTKIKKVGCELPALCELPKSEMARTE